MARKYEIGVRYFSHDTDMAWDKGIRKLSRRFGAAGYGIFNRLLECIYKDGYYKEVTDDFIFEICDSMYIDEDEELKIKELISYAVSVGLFSKEMYEEHNVITSHGIQVRYFQAKEQSIRHAITNEDDMEYKYVLIDIDSIMGRIKNTIKPKQEKPIEKKPSIKQPKEEEPLTDEEKRFHDYMENNFPRISKMSRPLKLSEYKDLYLAFGKEVLETTMANLENFKEINKRYVSAKSTLTNWCKNERTKRGSIPNATGLASDLQRISQVRRTNAEKGCGVSGELPDGGTPF